MVQVGKHKDNHAHMKSTDMVNGGDAFTFRPSFDLFSNTVDPASWKREMPLCLGKWRYKNG
jgi:hypothetical protein